MPLWVMWWNALRMLRPAFSRLPTFLWFATTVAGFTVRTEHLGVTSIVRALKLDAGCYGSYADLRIIPTSSWKRLCAQRIVLRRSA
jgi:hypothetical protein